MANRNLTEDPGTRYFPPELPACATRAQVGAACAAVHHGHPEHQQPTRPQSGEVVTSGENGPIDHKARPASTMAG